MMQCVVESEWIPVLDNVMKGLALFVFVFGFLFTVPSSNAKSIWRRICCSVVTRRPRSRKMYDVNYGTWRVGLSRRKDSKWVATHLHTNLNVHFGRREYGDFTIHKDPARRKAYIKGCTEKDQDWEDLSTAGAWSRHLLWEKESMQEAAKAMEDKFGVYILLGKSATAPKLTPKKRQAESETEEKES